MCSRFKRAMGLSPCLLRKRSRILRRMRWVAGASASVNILRL